MNVRKFHKNLRRPLLIVEVDGRLWATDSYWLTPFEGSWAEDLFRVSNLEPTPGSYDGWPYFTRTRDLHSTTLPAVTKILANTDVGVPLTLRTFDNQPLSIPGTGKRMALWDRPDDKTVLINPKVLRVVAPQDKNWWQVDLTQPARDGNDNPEYAAVRCGESWVMPCRRSA